MFKEERHLKIINYMRGRGRLVNGININEIVDKFKVSKSTVRRDLAELEEAGLLKRTHGGAILLESISNDYDFLRKQDENFEIKNEIARQAASLIEDGDVVAINSSTITYLIVKHIRARNIKIVTNSIGLLNELDSKSQLDILVLCGVYISSTKSIEGAGLVKEISKMHFDKTFIGGNGVDLSSGITTAGPIEVAGKQAMIENSDRSYLLCESNKFNRRAFYKIADFEDIDMIITDGRLSSQDQENYGRRVGLLSV